MDDTSKSREKSMPKQSKKSEKKNKVKEQERNNEEWFRSFTQKHAADRDYGSSGVAAHNVPKYCVPATKDIISSVRDRKS